MEKDSALAVRYWKSGMFILNSNIGIALFKKVEECLVVTDSKDREIESIPFANIKECVLNSPYGFSLNLKDGSAYRFNLIRTRPFGLGRQKSSEDGVSLTIEGMGLVMYRRYTREFLNSPVTEWANILKDLYGVSVRTGFFSTKKGITTLFWIIMLCVVSYGIYLAYTMP
jgi:hypothetical protein